MDVGVVSWSVGSDYEYCKVQKQKDSLSSPDPYFDEKCINDRNALAPEICEQIIQEKHVALLCLQRAQQYQMKDWLGDQYVIHGDTSDTAVAYDKNRFEFVDKCLKGNSWTILALKDKQSKKIFVVASAHLSPNADSNQGVYAIEEYNGAKGLVEAVEEVAKEYYASLAIIGMDIPGKGYDPSSGVLLNKGFTVGRGDALSSYFDKEPKSDYIFAKVYGKESAKVEERTLLRSESISDRQALLGRVTVQPQSWMGWTTSSCVML